ncbi:MAG: hypothetical protein LBL31_03735 [Spirochaetaceae bacterium]|jgi:hypothetical protein|nr:hypothetical protein [Spirochaetaceae bacterium]
MKPVLANGVEFDESKHEYWFEGRQLSGVTGLISKKLGLKMPQEFVEEHQEEGIHVHKAVRKWIETGDPESVHPGVRWLIETWDEKSLPEEADALSIHSEVLVSDFKKYASAVDIIVRRTDGGLVIYDIKKGLFKREYVTWQLSIYKYFIEKYAGRKVDACVCVCMKDRDYYDIFPKPFERVEKLLSG